MLSIRMQRLGRKGYPTYRMVVQDKRQTPTSGKVIAMLGNYNPHTKEVALKKDLAQKYLDNGAHPSGRVVALFKSEGIKIPKWVKIDEPGKKSVKNPEKLRRNRPAEPVEEKLAEAEEPKTENEAPAEETKSDETPEVATEEPAEEKSEDVAEAEPKPEDSTEEK